MARSIVSSGKKQFRGPISQLSRSDNPEPTTTAPTNADLQRARAVGLLVLPPSIDGARCGNCSFFERDFCKHMEVLQGVEEHFLCTRWDSPGTEHVGRQ